MAKNNITKNAALFPVRSDGAVQARIFMSLVGNKIYPDAWNETDLQVDTTDQSIFFVGHHSIPAHRKLVVENSIIVALHSAQIAAEVDLKGIDVSTVYDKARRADFSLGEDYSRFFPDGPPARDEQQVRHYAMRHAQELLGRTGIDELNVNLFLDSKGDLDHKYYIDLELCECVGQHVKLATMFYRELPDGLVGKVKKDYWKEYLFGSPSRMQIDWRRSEVSIGYESLIISEEFLAGREIDEDEPPLSKRKLQRIPPDVKEELMSLRHPLQEPVLFFRNGAEAADVVAEMPSWLADIGWAERHYTNSGYAWPVIYAAIWRIVAITKPSIDRGFVVRIREQLKDYLGLEIGQSEIENLRSKVGKNSVPADSSLDDAINEVLRQFKGKKISAPIIPNIGRGIPRK